MSIVKMSIDKMSIDKMSIDKMSIDKMSIDKMSIDKNSYVLSLFYRTAINEFNTKIVVNLELKRFHLFISLFLLNCLLFVKNQ